DQALATALRVDLDEPQGIGGGLDAVDVALSPETEEREALATRREHFRIRERPARGEQRARVREVFLARELHPDETPPIVEPGHGRERGLDAVPVAREPALAEALDGADGGVGESRSGRRRGQRLEARER